MEACGLLATHLAFLRVSLGRVPPLAILTERPFWFFFEDRQEVVRGCRLPALQMALWACFLLQAL